MTEQELTNLCREWQERLGLAHWGIDITFVRGVEIDDANAQVDYQLVAEQALIRVKDSVDYHGYFKQDAEQSIVHELLHIIFAADGGPMEGIAETMHEQAIDRTARALIDLKRQIPARELEQ